MTEKVRSFRLYTPKPIVVTKSVADYSQEEQLRFREVFRPVAERYRQYVRRALVAAVVAFICWGASMWFFPKVGLAWVLGVLFAALIGLVVVA